MAPSTRAGSVEPCEEQTLCFEGAGCGCLPAMPCGVVVVNSHEHKAHGVLDRRETCMAPRLANAAKSPWAPVTSYSLVDRAKDRQCDDWHHGQDHLTGVGQCPDVWVGMLRSALGQNVPHPYTIHFFQGLQPQSPFPQRLGNFFKVRVRGENKHILNHQPVISPPGPQGTPRKTPSPTSVRRIFQGASLQPGGC